jgi:hypothetical protein
MDNSAVFEAFYNNGPVEVGLEVGSDPGVAAANNVKIPRSMARTCTISIEYPEPNWYDADGVLVSGDWSSLSAADSSVVIPPHNVRFPTKVPDLAEGADAAAVAAHAAATKTYQQRLKAARDAAAAAHKAAIDADDAVGRVTVSGMSDDLNNYTGLMRHEGKTYYTVRRNGEWTNYDVSKVHIGSLTPAMVRDFYTANVVAAAVPGITEELQNFVHACRLVGVISGFVTTHHSREFEIVDTPANTHAGADAFFRYFTADGAIAQFATAISARVSNWRRANHATCGDIASGFAKKVLQRAGFWAHSGDRAEVRAHHRRVTTAFYLGTHPCGVHAGLAAFVPDDSDHFAYVDPRFGYKFDWSLRPSAMARIAPKTQVAGTALVTDSIVVLRSLLKSNLAPLVDNLHQLNALAAAYDEVADKGMRVGVARKWFFADHPDDTRTYEFNQKDEAYAALVGTLATAATTFLAGTTIGQSPALANAAAGAADEAASLKWSALAARRTQMSGDAFVDAATALGVAMGSVAGITSTNATVRAAAVDAANGINRAVARALGTNAPDEIDLDDVAARVGDTA